MIDDIQHAVVVIIVVANIANAVSILVLLAGLDTFGQQSSLSGTPSLSVSAQPSLSTTAPKGVLGIDRCPAPSRHHRRPTSPSRLHLILLAWIDTLDSSLHYQAHRHYRCQRSHHYLPRLLEGCWDTDRDIRIHRRHHRRHTHRQTVSIRIGLIAVGIRAVVSTVRDTVTIRIGAPTH